MNTCEKGEMKMDRYLSGIRVWAGVAAVALMMSLGMACDDPEIDEGPPADGAPAEDEPSVDDDGRIIFDDVADEAGDQESPEVPDEAPEVEEAEPPAEAEEVEEAEEEDGDDE